MIRRQGFDWDILSSAEFQMVTGILGVAMKQPDLIITPDGKPYLYRWHVIPRNEKANVYLHIQTGPDAGRDMHDHPWDNQSVILSGCYLEHLPYLAEGQFPVVRRPGDVIHRQAEGRHRLELLPGVTHSISLFSTGPKVREWGFWTPKGWVPWTEMADNEGNYSTEKEAA